MRTPIFQRFTDPASDTALGFVIFIGRIINEEFGFNHTMDFYFYFLRFHILVDRVGVEPTTLALKEPYSAS